MTPRADRAAPSCCPAVRHRNVTVADGHSSEESSGPLANNRQDGRVRTRRAACPHAEWAFPAPGGAPMEDPRPLPEGTVTLLFTDIEGSTRLLQQLGSRYAALLADHHRLLRS